MKKEIADLRLNGCETVARLKQSCSSIPESPGVYFVLREITESEVKILPCGPVPMHKGKDMTYSVDDLKRKWVEGTQIIYIGKTDSSLRTRIRAYINFGKGKDSPHRGGRAIWQLADSDKFIIGWRLVEPGMSARAEEAELIKQFKVQHGGKLPFANRTE